MAKISVIGLDGVNWTILNHAIEKGLMPNLEQIKQESYKAELETTYPPVTGPAWTSIMTGVNPGKHGVFDFVDHLENGRPYNSTDIDTETIYEKVAQKGDVTIVNLPLSYPPKYNGEFVGSFLAPEDDYIKPETLKQKYDFTEYKKSLSAKEKSLNVVKSAEKTAKHKKQLLEKIHGGQDLFYLLFSAPDWIMHNLYHEMEKGEPEEAYQVFKTIDEAIKTAWDNSENIILLSDHGFQSFNKVFHVNQWLKNNGYLETKGSMEAQWSENKIINLFTSIISKSPLLRKISRKTYLSIEDHLPLPENVKVRLGAVVSEGIDREKSQAFCPSSGIRGIYINDKRFDGTAEQPEKIKQEIREKLPEKIQHTSRGQVFKGKHKEKAPDIVFTEKTHRISRSIYGQETSQRKVNHHGRKGFLIAEGKNIKEKPERKERTLYDIAPTISEIFSISANDTDGKPLPTKGTIQLEDKNSDLPTDF